MKAKRVHGTDMPSADTVERLRWQLGRCEQWVGNADTKATIVLGLNGALVAGVLAVDPQIVSQFLDGGWIHSILAVSFFLATLWSMVWAGLAVLPNLGSAKSGGSIFHYLDVMGMNMAQFRSDSRELTSWGEIEALEHQVFTVSQIAGAKFQKLRRSTLGLIAGTVLGALTLLVNNA